MTVRALFGGGIILLCLAITSLLSAHEIHLKNGTVIKSSVVERRGPHLTYEQFGGSITIPLSEVNKIIYDTKRSAPPLSQKRLATASTASRVRAENLAELLEAELAPTTAVETANLAVVSVKTEAGFGSGFFVSEDGLIITNRHVIRGSELQNKQVEAKFSEADGQLSQWRRSLDLEENRLVRYEQNLRNSWSSLNQAINDPNNRIDPRRLADLQASLQDKSGYAKKWRADYDARRRNFAEQRRKVEKSRQEIFQRNQKLSRQSRFSITLANGSEKSVLLYKISKQLDLALLKLNGYRTPYLQPADSKAITLGQRVFAIGSPLQLNNSVTSGVISSFRDDYVQTNAEIYPGNSGGPLITEKGDVLGVNTMKAITEKYEGLGFAIPISRVYSEFSDFFPR
ncbi:MAG: S1C family serine protease [Deltaproteobacteria bacterium]|nr:S1C family serine protease [Deltaproteobacteria bacterium]